MWNYVLIGENSADDQMELTARTFVFNTRNYAGGSVGIGVTAPTEKLEVDGTVKATAFAGDGSGLSNIPASAVITPPPGMVRIPAGPFTMGADPDGGTPVTATLSAFHLAIHEVSFSQWQPVYFRAKENGYTDLPSGNGKEPNHPVHSVNWHDVEKWCKARSEMENLAPCYTVSGAICRTGGSTYTSPAGSFDPNGYGFYDMAGKVWDWCRDCYASSSYMEGASNPKGADSGSGRVCRGGSWASHAIFCRSACRNNSFPGYTGGNVGFRPARSSVP